jgi:K+-sensing histidine kinase KdpD
MAIWLNRFTEKPLWSGLGEAWPAYRSTHPELKTKKNTKEIEEYYIPESWFIQQLVEGGIIFFILFVSILWIILRRLLSVSPVIFWLLVAILVMNVFLHVFEATYLSILLFIFIWVFYGRKHL